MRNRSRASGLPLLATLVIVLIEYTRLYANESATHGLDVGSDLVKVCGKRALAHECFAVPAACRA